jgi:hypothetical protein
MVIFDLELLQFFFVVIGFFDNCGLVDRNVDMRFVLRVEIVISTVLLLELVLKLFDLSFHAFESLIARLCFLNINLDRFVFGHFNFAVSTINCDCLFNMNCDLLLG